MTTEETKQLVQVLEDSRADFNTSVDGLSDSHASTHVEAGCWSILDCVEHVAFVEERFQQRLQQAERLAEPRVDKSREAELATRVLNRVTRFEAPEVSRPSGRFTTLAEAISHYNSVRGQTIEFAQNHSADLHWLQIEHPRFGTLNGVELLTLMAGHSRRHIEQIREVRSALGC